MRQSDVHVIFSDEAKSLVIPYQARNLNQSLERNKADQWREQ